ncbi:hypothetical protein KEM55_002077 [Ascosphaera atra]|nr:hypothetical protein KEM55_002077 [Ascosphaera atra]
MALAMTPAIPRPQSPAMDGPVNIPPMAATSSSDIFLASLGNPNRARSSQVKRKKVTWKKLQEPLN